MLLHNQVYKVPHFTRLGDVEVNAGQNTTFQCVANGRASKMDPFTMERHNGLLMVPYSLTSSVGERRLAAWFQIDRAQRTEQDLYRCITQSSYGAAVSNFAELIVRVPPTPIAPPQLLRSGPTYLIIQLNTNSIVGDGPVIRREIVYRASHSPWSETHGVSSLTYKVWHLEPDTEYRISVLLTRPGEGGTGPPGPPLVSRTKCAEPMRPLRGLTASEIQPRQLVLQWEPLGYNLTRCHTYSLSLCYRYYTATGSGAITNNATVRECLSVEKNMSRFTLRDLPPFRPVHVRLALTNPEGKKESREVTFQTDEDIPGGIAPESLTLTPLDDMIFLKWEEPVEPNGLITQYEISYQSIESFDPSVNVPGPRRTISKLKNETYHMFSGLQPGTTYLVSVRARTAKGFGQTTLTEITTNISAPAFDYEDIPAPLSESESTITVLLRPALARGAPVSAYHVVVVEEDGSRQVKRRELGHHDCFPSLRLRETLRGEQEVFLRTTTRPNFLPAAFSQPPHSPWGTTTPTTVTGTHPWPREELSHLSAGGEQLQRGDPDQLHSDSTESHHASSNVSISLHSLSAACKDHKHALEISQNSEDMGLILGASAGGLVVFVLLLAAIVIIVKKGRKKVNMNKAAMPYRQEKKQRLGSLDCSTADQGTLQQDERTTHTFMDVHSCSARTDQRSSVNESSSLLGGSPRRHCCRKNSPYHTGQLRPAVRVADLLQHINQMKTSECYGFKQEYESFFDGWDITKRKDKTKGRHDTLLAHDRHHVKMHSLLADPNSDYVNANYIDGYQRSNHFIATQGPKQDMIYDFWRMVWQENCYSIVMITKLVEVGRVKCCKYWPDDSEVYGDIKITLLKTETLCDYIVRTFTMERRGYPAKHEVCQFHFTSWPEHGVPYHATGLLAFLRRVKASTPPDTGPVVVHCSMGAGRTGCYIVLDVMLDMAECEGVVDIYNCVKTLCSQRINMIQTEEQYVFIHDAILEACLCGETAIPVSDFALTYKDILRVDTQSNTSQLREEFQTLNSVTPHLDVEECSVSLLPRNREKNRSMDVLPPDRALAFLVTTDVDGGDYINAALMDSFLRPATFVVTPHPLPNTTADFWRLVFDYGCTSIVMLNQINQSNSAWLMVIASGTTGTHPFRRTARNRRANSGEKGIERKRNKEMSTQMQAHPCLQYWPETGMQQFGPMTVELLSRSTDDDVITRLFRVNNITRLQEGNLVVRHFQFLRWSAYRDIPDSKKAFLTLLAQVQKWQRECGDGRIVVHCLNGGGRSGTFCACTMIMEMIRHHSMVDVFYAVKTLRNSKSNMVETLNQH
ncbi:hypothetical protein QTP86_024949 [Hemibagrus guttatus]|nr:hypothetical protein QTP86_024949 [Hemibagrus guttatus]